MLGPACIYMLIWVDKSFKKFHQGLDTEFPDWPPYIHPSPIDAMSQNHITHCSNIPPPPSCQLQFSDQNRQSQAQHAMAQPQTITPHPVEASLLAE